MTDENGTPVVLAVDDEERVTEAYALWLSDDYSVRTAADGDDALAAMDETVDVVLLDRDMPNVRGDEALSQIRERGYDCRVAMVTGVTPDVDIVELGFDTYVTKPVGEDELRETVADLLARDRYGDRAQRFFSLAEKRATLETELDDGELADSEEYAALTRAVNTLQRDLDGTLSGLDDRVVQASYRDL